MSGGKMSGGGGGGGGGKVSYIRYDPSVNFTSIKL